MPPEAPIPSRLRAVAGMLLAGAGLTVLGGCQLKYHDNLVNGKKLFVSRCGSCHALSHASSKGIPGPPNLDEAFGPARHDGLGSSTVRGVVYDQILHPNQNVPNDPTGTYRMPANLARGPDAHDIAAYVSQVAGVPGQDTGTLATAVLSVARTPAVEKASTLQIDADPTGQLQFLAPSATGKPGSVTINSKNASSTQHNISIQGAGVNLQGPIVANGGVSTIHATLKPGTYTFYCSVPGHQQAGMQGTLTVK